MIPTVLASRFAGGPKVAKLAAIFSVGLTIATLAPAHADQNLSPTAQTVRTALIALSAADAATPLATAHAAANEVAAPASSAALKPDTANAMASVRTASARRAEPAYFDRRVTYRPSRDPFFLAVGIAY